MTEHIGHRLLGAIIISLTLAACGGSAPLSPALDRASTAPEAPDAPTSEPPNEGVILVEELLHMVRRSGIGSLPSDPDQVLQALTTLPNGLGDVLAMHLGRLYPTPHEFTPGMGPLMDLLQARAELLLSGDQATRLLEDTMDGQVSILLLPVDATTVIVILPTQVVKARADATPLPEARLDLSALTYEINGRSRTVADFLNSGSTNAIGFMHDGRFVYDAYENGFNPNTRAHMWSVTKSVTTALTGIAVAEGLIESIQDPITKYLAETVGTVWEGVSIEDLLQMESGTYWVDVPVHQPEQLVLMGVDFHSNGLFGMTRDEYLLQLTRVSPTGDHHRYNSGDAQMLAWLLERLYQRPYAEILSEKIWQPAGMQDDALVMVDRLGNTFASMGLMATPRDMLRFGELFRSGGRSLDGRQIVPEAWVAASHNYDKATGGGPRGYMWPHWGGIESGNYAAVGYAHQVVSIAPSLNLVGVRFGNDPGESIRPAEWEAMLTAVGRHLEGGDAP